MTVTVIGVGNPFRQDDGVGSEAVRRLRGTLPTGACAAACRCDPGTLIDLWSGASAVIIIDAAEPAGEPGRVIRVDQPDGLAVTAAASTHGVGLAEAWALADALGSAPRRLAVFAVEGQSFDYGVGLSAPVEVALPALVDAVRTEARRLLDDLNAAEAHPACA